MRLLLFVLLTMFVLPVSAQVRWERLSETDSVQTLLTLSKTHWVILERDTLKRTTNAGASWIRIVVPLEFAVNSKLLWDWKEDGRGMLLQSSEGSAWRDSSRCSLALTTDNGGTWTIHEFKTADRLAVPIYELPEDIALAEDSGLLLCVADSLFRSRDGGNSFTHQPLDIPAKTLTFMGDNYGWIRSSDKRAAVTRDGGLTWESQSLIDRAVRLMVDLDGRSILMFPGLVYISDPYGTDWDTLSPPVDGHLIANNPNWMGFAIFDRNDIWAFPESSPLGTNRTVYLTQDRGMHWSSVQGLGVKAVQRLDAERALVHADGVYSLTIPSRRPFGLQVVNYSSLTHPMIKLDWSDPGYGPVAGYRLERAGGDSAWTELIAPPEPPAQFFIDNGLAEDDWGPFRYRLSLATLSGDTLVAASDSVSVQMGRFVEILDAILPDPDEANVLTYEHLSKKWKQREGWSDDTTIIVTYTFYVPKKTSPWETLHPIRNIARGETGEIDTIYGGIIEYADSLRSFQFYNVSPGYDGGLGESGLLSWALHSQISTVGRVRKESLLPAGTLGLQLFDSLLIETSYYLAIGNEQIYRYICRSPSGYITSIDGYEQPSSHGGMEMHLRLISSGLSVGEPMSAAESVVLSPAYPNPFRSDVTINIQITRTAPVQLTVHDMLGRTVATLKDGPCEAGKYAFTFQPRDLSSGVYICRLRVGNEVKTSRMVRMR